MPVTNPSVYAFAVGNTTQSSQHTLGLSNFSVQGAGFASVGISNGSVVVSATGCAFSAANGSFGGSTLAFLDSNNVTFRTSVSPQGIVAQAALNLFAVSNTTQSSSGSADIRSVSFAGAGIASVGVTNGSVVVSVPSGGGAGDGGVFAGVSTAGNTAGSTGTVSTGNLVLVGTNGITLSQSTGAAGSAATITIVGDAITASQWAPYAIGQQGGGGQQGQATMHLAPISAPFEATFDRVQMYLSRSNNSASTGSVTISAWFGLFTRQTGGSSTRLSRYASASQTYGITFHGTVSSWSLHAGARLVSLGLSTSVSRGEYWAACITQTTSGGADCTWNQMLLSQFTANFSGEFNVASNATKQEVLGKGVYSASTTGIPASVAFSEINGTASLALRAPVWLAINGSI